MKKIVLGGITAMVVIVLTAISVNLYSQTSLAVANAEALATSDSSGGPKPCGGEKISGECQCRNTVNCKDLYGCQ
jgi:hypothetical protein